MMRIAPMPNGPAHELEGLPAAVPRLLSNCSLPSLFTQTGNRLKEQNLDSETGELVPRDDMARGYEVAKGQYKRYL
jgi:hypothetical protein